MRPAIWKAANGLSFVIDTIMFGGIKHEAEEKVPRRMEALYIHAVQGKASVCKNKLFFLIWIF